MVTFKIEVGKPQRDGSRALYIRVTKDREYKRIRFYVDVDAKDLTDSGDIKDPKLDILLNDTINDYKHKLYDAGMESMNWSVSEIVEYLTSNKKEKDTFKLDFIAFGREFAKELDNQGKDNTARGYNTALNSFCAFLGKDSIDINEITKAMLLNYQDWFNRDGSKARAWEYYMSNLKALHNRAKKLYNDEDDEKLNIKLSPFKNIEYKIPMAKKREIVKRAISPAALRYLWQVPMEMLTDRAKTARDAYFLSFALCGMNAIDMWKHTMAEDCPEDLIEYYRSKTVDRSGPDSYIRVHVHPYVMEIHRRHRRQRKTWDFGSYSNPNGLNITLSKGMRAWVTAAVEFYGAKWHLDPVSQRTKILKRLELPTDDNLDFYSARHSFATIAANDCHIPLEIVDRCQCHSVNSVAANSYIKKDYRFVDETAGKVMAFVFKDVISDTTSNSNKRS